MGPDYDLETDLREIAQLEADKEYERMYNK
jgi:hypothetical protein